jgi:hypothetical protein
MSVLDTEWMKFMTRISRQQNCDNADESSGGEEECSDGGGGAGLGLDIHMPPVPLLPQSTSVKTANPSSKPSLNKKSCISKKAQRRTYSFLDTATTTTTTALTEPNTAETLITASSSTEENPIGSLHPTISPIYISTKTKIAYLNKPVNIYDAFWDVPVQHYYERKEGVIKKQIKFQTTDPTFIASIKEKLENQPRCYEEFIIEHIENPNGRIQYKDQRKVSIGLCKKDLQGNNIKKKRAFFNCFVLILRIHGGIAPIEERAPEDDILYKEMHVKVFNTGKLEIPGIQEDITLIHVLRLLVAVLRPHLGEDLDFLQNRCETALINSNFNCGFYIDRDRLFQLLKYKYRMNCNYDSCSYPGIQSKFYYIPGKDIADQSGQQPISIDHDMFYEVSFMIFRTGSILIVGKCNEEILMVIYRFICTVLTKEYAGIQMGDIPNGTGTGTGTGTHEQTSKEKGVKNSRKKRLQITNIRYYEPELEPASSS